MSQAQTVDPISIALQARARQVALQDESDLIARRKKEELQALVDQPTQLEVPYLVALLRATWERLPDELDLVGWESPTTTDDLETLNEALQIGAAVADVFTVYETERGKAT